jgi:hypothetical protein
VDIVTIRSQSLGIKWLNDNLPLLDGSADFSVGKNHATPTVPATTD